jgi:DNA-binding NarL/FixJ family response regulator
MSWKSGRPKAVCEAIQIAARAFGLEPEAVLRRTNERQPVAARRYVAVQLRVRGYSTTQIGRVLGLHHTTVLYHLQARPRCAPPRPPIEWNGIDESGVWAI